MQVVPRPIDATTEFVLVYPHGMDLGNAASALDAAGIAHQAAAFPYDTTESPHSHVLYLIDEARLCSLGDQETVEHALFLIGVTQAAYTIVVAERNSEAAYLAGNPYVAGWLTAPLDPVALVATVGAAATMLRLQDEAEALRERNDEVRAEAETLTQIGVKLSSERDVLKLHQHIVRSARQLTRADAGSLFLLEDGDDGQKMLRFAVAQTGPGDDGGYLGFVFPASRQSISGFVGLTGEVIRLEDAYHIPSDVEYKFNDSFDKKNNYRTKSVLCVPMRDHNDTVVGVIQLLNRKPDFDLILTSPEYTEAVAESFTDRDERLLLSMASQAGVALENKALLESIQDLFEQFVKASVKAIEVRDKSTQGHSSRVAELTVLQGEAINSVQAGPLKDLHFDADQLREMRYASLLHDFGKVAVPEYIFGKAKKLPDGRLDAIRLRFLLAIEQIEATAARELFDLMKAGHPPDDPRFRAVEERRTSKATQLRDLLEQVTNANEPRVVAGDVADVLDQIAGMSYRDIEAEAPLLTPAELDYLRIPRGSLSADERLKMEQHVTQSFYFLREIPWSKTPWPGVPEYAYGHHEHLDGTGYPRGLKHEEIAPQVRLLTISDVFDALTAKDRPYKPAMPTEKAIDILQKEFAGRGKVDPLLLDLFLEKKVYEPVLAARDAAGAA